MSELDLFLDILLKTLPAIAAGGIIGLERQRKHKSAGLKTNILICVGASIFTSIAHVTGDPARIVAQIISGIGFLGAGAILHPTVEKVSGLTTAAMVWAVAALGILSGLGHGLSAIGLSLLICSITLAISRIERAIHSTRP